MITAHFIYINRVVYNTTQYRSSSRLSEPARVKRITILLEYLETGPAAGSIQPNNCHQNYGQGKLQTSERRAANGQSKVTLGCFACHVTAMSQLPLYVNKFLLAHIILLKCIIFANSLLA